MKNLTYDFNFSESRKRIYLSVPNVVLPINLHIFSMTGLQTEQRVIANAYQAMKEMTTNRIARIIST